jgi:hypothetical protein
MDLSALAPYLAGPGAAVLVLLFVISMAYRLLIHYGLPLVKVFAERHLAQIDRMIDQQREETQVMVLSLNNIDQRLNKIEMYVLEVNKPGAL